MTTIYLAMSMATNALSSLRTHDWEVNPISMLVSYVYRKYYLNIEQSVQPERLMLDSGAFSVWKSGKKIDLEEYAAWVKDVWKERGEVVALDAIGDDRASLVQYEKLSRLGVNSIPVFHVGDDWGILKEYHRTTERIGLSCRFGEPINISLRWLDQCFAREWPARFHSFGWTQKSMLMRYPFFTADSVSYNLQASVYNRWSVFGNMRTKMPPGKHKRGLEVFIARYVKLQEILRVKWKKEFNYG
jgi:hypothetical protein